MSKYSSRDTYEDAHPDTIEYDVWDKDFSGKQNLDNVEYTKIYSSPMPFYESEGRPTRKYDYEKYFEKFINVDKKEVPEDKNNVLFQNDHVELKLEIDENVKYILKNKATNKTKTYTFPKSGGKRRNRKSKKTRKSRKNHRKSKRRSRR